MQHYRTKLIYDLDKVDAHLNVFTSTQSSEGTGSTVGIKGTLHIVAKFKLEGQIPVTRCVKRFPLNLPDDRSLLIFGLQHEYFHFPANVGVVTFLAYLHLDSFDRFQIIGITGESYRHVQWWLEMNDIQKYYSLQSRGGWVVFRPLDEVEDRKEFRKGFGISSYLLSSKSAVQIPGVSNDRYNVMVIENKL